MFFPVEQSSLLTLCELLDSYKKIRNALKIDVHVSNATDCSYFGCIYCIFVFHEFPSWSTVGIYSHVFAGQMRVLGDFETRGNRHRQTGLQALKVLGPQMGRAEVDMGLYGLHGDAPLS